MPGAGHCGAVDVNPQEFDNRGRMVFYSQSPTRPWLNERRRKCVTEIFPPLRHNLTELTLLPIRDTRMRPPPQLLRSSRQVSINCVPLRRYAGSMVAKGELSTPVTTVFKACGLMDQSFRNAAFT